MSYAVLQAIRNTIPTLRSIEVDDADFLSGHKQLVQRVITPTLTIMTLTFIAAYFSLDRNTLLGMLVVVVMAGINIFMTSKDRSFSFGSYTVRSRSDISDCLRWVFNFTVGDPLLMLLVRPEEPSALLGAWLLFMIGAQMDTFSNRHRWVVLLTGLLSASILFAILYPQMPLRSILYAVTCLGCALTILIAIENFWVQSAVRERELQKGEIEMNKRATLLKVEANIGDHAKQIMHELANIAQVIDFHTPERRSDSLAALSRAVDYIKRIQGVFLSIQENSATRFYSIENLITDLNIFAKKYVIRNDISWSVEQEEGLNRLYLKENSGIAYMIMYNLIRNGCDAIAETNRKDGKVSVAMKKAYTKGGSVAVRISVKDNGVGLDADSIKKIHDRTMRSSKKDGHGLGLKFCVTQCLRNKFQLTIKSTPGKGSSFTVIAPVFTEAEVTMELSNMNKPVNRRH